jgi:aquaporin related protein
MPSSSRLPRRDEYTTAPHPDAYERSRPPRTYRNVDGWERGPSNSSKTYFDESRSEFPKDRDLEKGPGPEWVSGERLHRRKSTDESIDGYNYEAHKSGGTKGTLDLNNLSPEERAMVMRLPWTHWMNSEFKNREFFPFQHYLPYLSFPLNTSHPNPLTIQSLLFPQSQLTPHPPDFVATIGEFVGTTMFLFFAFAGTQVANIDSSTSNTTTGGATGFNVSVELYIAIIFGFSLMVNVWIFFRISGGLFNPAVTLGMVLVGALPIVRAICLFFAQIIGGITASAMVLGLFPTTFNVRTTLGPGTSTVRGVFIEAILTAELVFTIFMLAKEKHKATFIAPVGIGLALFIAEMVGVFYTGGSLNPARSFGPCVVSGDFDKEHWIYCKFPFFSPFHLSSFPTLLIHLSSH